ncbi:quinoprotein relay system zinc metallohydrolase 2 [Roseovarius aestuarii]|uniref:Hydroxyacylglutathione hydrolase n=1 Tax=Roseovarius aestuarii TaxID=475083 RepID=A0A1X7BWC1_9RHOB|nr:quinoprotein relay system zinc metallohydrolase 2 [Roseovarius aestuarii]SMC13937.1 Hydroxyacylglutathione hydrolase [Roseovarius aestuarii]
MFEAVIMACLVADPALCRPVLLPGYEASALAACEAALADRPPVPTLAEGIERGAITCQPIGPVARVEEVAAGVFAHRAVISDAAPENGGDVGNAGFVIGGDSVAMIDAGGAAQVGEALYRAIRAKTDLPVSHVILTHMHPDHVLGASVFAAAGAEVVGHAGLSRALTDRAQTYLDNFGRLIGKQAFIGTRVLLPDVTVESSMSLDLGGRVLELRAWPSSHTGSDLTVGDVTTGTLFTGDLVFHVHTPALDGSVLGWQSVLADLRGIEGYTQIVPGHGGPVLDWPDGGGALAGYLDVLVDETREAIARGDSLAEAVEKVATGEMSKWELFDLFNPRNATVAYTELEWE